ncbi:DUF317 domain-containing protein [Streptomyces sp. NPDC048718]|uniref:DUF317 domain-containing protein n=1 Tax=Streptomyces sp. NPDC048718 TaxID=3365587 RepID=UPI0037150083
MPYAPADAHVHFALHPDHHPAVVATTSGPTADAARSHLHDLGFRPTSPTTMVLARIDREEPHYTDQAAKRLRQLGFTIEIDPSLQEDMDTEWEWGNYPMPWCTREEVREVSAEAQRIHDDIADGRLTIHLHADDGHTTVAVGSYATGVRRHVHLHGENHLRQVAVRFDEETEANAEFRRLYSVAVYPGPAPLTELETTVHRVIHGEAAPVTSIGVPAPASPPVAGPGEHEEFLAAFLDDNPQWEKYRTWAGDATIASHESLTVRAEFYHEARHRTHTAWTVAEYDGPIGERVWHAALTTGTPVALIRALLQHLDAPTPVGGVEPYEPLRDAGWHPASHPARTTWRAPDRTMVFEHTPHATEARWTLYGGKDLDCAAWSIRLSSGAGEELLAELAASAVALTPAPTAAAAPRTVPAPGLPPSVPQRHGRVR